MAQPLTDTPAVNSAIAAAQNLPDLVDKLSAINPALAEQLKGKSLAASKTVWGMILGLVLAHLAGKYGLKLPPDDISYVDGGVVIVLTAIFRKITSGPVTGWFSSAPTAALPATAPKIAATIMALLMVNALAGCTSTQIASGVAMAERYQQDVSNACAIANARANDPAAILIAASVPSVAQAVTLVRAGCGTEEAIGKLVLDPLSVAWIGTLTQTIASKGAVVPPPPVAPSAAK